MEAALRAGDRLAIVCLVDPEPEDLARSAPWLEHRADLSIQRDGKRFVLVEAGAANGRCLEQLLDNSPIRDPKMGGIGIAIFPEHGDDPDSLCHAAWLATRNDEAAHPGARGAASREPTAAADDKRRWELHYQPQVDLRNGLVTTVEALARSPASSAYPASGWYQGATIEGEREFGFWVLERAIQDLRSWPLAQGRQLRVAINLSLDTVQSSDLIDRVAGILQENCMPPASLEIELTEQRPCLDHGAVVASLERLRALGVRLALDDFGTGFASLTRFNGLPLDTVKIDQSFIACLGGDDEPAEAEQLVRDVIALARRRGLRVVAEGVERAAQLALLSRLGCDAFQGYLFSPPLPGHALSELLSGDAAGSPCPGG